MGQKTERLGLSLLSSAVRCPLTVDKFLHFRVSIEQAGNALGKVGHQILSQLPSTSPHHRHLLLPDALAG